MTFKEEINSGVPVLVDFYADWCGPCRMMLPAIEAISRQHKVIKVNIEDEVGRELSVEYAIGAVPTIIVFKDGQPIKRLVGLQSKENLELALRECRDVEKNKFYS